MKQNGFIHIEGAKVNNLKNITVDIPINKFVVITGVSGSGKTSLAFDTLYAEGQRRYVESLSSYARQFFGRVTKPNVDKITGISPAIAIDRKTTVTNSRSTVGTSTEIYEYLKLLFARLGKTYSPVSGNEVKKYTSEDIVNQILQIEEGASCYIYFAVNTDSKAFVKQLEMYMGQGYSRLMDLTDLNLKAKDSKIEYVNIADILDDKTKQKKYIKNGEFYVMVDRFKTKEKDDDYIQRLTNSIETALYDGNGECYIIYSTKNKEIKTRSFSDKFEADGIEFESPTPDLFSFNSPYGACPKCQGFGNVIGYDEDLVIPDRTLSVYQNAVVCWRGDKMQEWKNQLIENSFKDNFPIHKPIAELSDKEYDMLWEGTDNFYGINDFFKYIESKAYKIQYRVMASRFRGKSICPSCKGKRLRPEAYYVKFKGKTINDIVTTPIDELLEYFNNLVLDKNEEIIASRILKELKQRLGFLYSVGLDYLTLSRTTNTLSGGELQRINLSTALGSNLTGSMYILDEPSVGLHSNDTNRLISAIYNLRDLGNTVIVVEHDEDIIRAADYVIDIGPYAGRLGGEVMFAGTVDQLLKADSLTAKYLKGELTVPISKVKRKVRNKIIISGAREFNLKNITVEFPLNMLTVVAGVSGSGKSTLVNEILFPALKRHFNDFSFKPGKYSKLSGDLSAITDVELIDQNSITRSSRSNPVTYIGAFDDIRNLFAQQKLSKLRGYKPGTFSYNVAGGRCEECEGEGFTTVEMQFLADVKLVCEECGGKRYKEEVLEVLYKDKNIFDILDLTIDDALDLFAKGKSTIEKRIVNKLTLLTDVGLGYIKMGQSLSTLSSGEAQRVKLATFLSKAETDSPKLFIFDEPTTGLHFHDIAKLLKSFNALIENGHSIIVIEHNQEIIKAADYIIELGPKGGNLGGYLIRGESCK